MKHVVLLSICLFFAVLFSTAQQVDASLPALPNQEGISTDTLLVSASARQPTALDSLDSAFKYTEIIPGLKKDNNFLTERLFKQLHVGRHDLFYGVERAPRIDVEEPIQTGKLKSERPIWVLGIAFFLFLVLAILRIIFPMELRTIVDAYYKERLLLQVSKEDNLATSWPYIFLYALFSLSLGLFIVLVMSSFSDKNYLTFENFIKNAIFVAVLFIAKILIIRFVSFIFSLEKIVREYVAVLYLVYFNSMFLLMPFLLALLFVPVAYFQIITIVYVVLIIILFAYRFFRTAFHLFGNFKFSIFYLILYLCSLELAPILILVRALSK
ncbi:DUF4271 domain-containing protein [Sphingobacterium sp. DK4209]|uniref:DUF4271 domain-containing protein n=1 Tax=Sphingobacterium zhuxiongii TaxID=2662364 RepID=A0A5Q0QDX4_9SPHI|nr:MULTISPECIES: DUF4271 domain-containing protein [unclassified Sphingobacterium]MVZ65598.1 DUF4271 domain-containing protein [Sphingobacterium sp. DK4209]QGA27723.1 DUF4271 domain-containing protein [Sphingobacterium sp. dk4302]